MIPSSSALVSLKPARQAALQAIMTVEEARQRGARLPSMPHVRTFLRLLTGCSRINSDVARRIPGLHRDPKDRLSSLKQVEEALDMLISSHGEYCPLPLTMDVQAELFPEVLHTRTVRRLKRQDFAFTRKMRREARQVEQSWLLRQNLLGQAVTELNFQSPETVCTWYTRWSDEFDAAELAAPFWRWQSRFASLKELDWLRISGEPLYAVMYEIPLLSGKHLSIFVLLNAGRCQISWLIGVVYEVALFSALETAAQALPGSTGTDFRCRGGRAGGT
ncbi:recombinase (plasmid) [Klebsiella quasipneumoniae]|nr:recombinase [Klebsiella quasipneumoniae]